MSSAPSTGPSMLLLSALLALSTAACVGDPSAADPDGPIGVNNDGTPDSVSGGKPGALIVNKRDDGGDDRWGDDQKMNLTYCVSPSFGNDHDEVAAAMEAAGNDWANAAAVRFVYRPEEDASCDAGNRNVLFEVMPVSGTSYNAKSFFPSMVARGQHELDVDLDNVRSSRVKSLHGVLLHEMGHILGFRHEHARPESNGVCAEGPDWRPLTPYDPESVMHYNHNSPCLGSNGGDYHLTSFDREGAQGLYGPPGQGQVVGQQGG